MQRQRLELSAANKVRTRTTLGVMVVKAVICMMIIRMQWQSK